MKKIILTILTFATYLSTLAMKDDQLAQAWNQVLKNNRNLKLIKASSDGNLEKAQSLISSGADANAIGLYNYTPLICAAQNGHTNLCELLLNHNALVDAQDQNGYTALIKAAREGHNDVCQLLLENGAQVNARNERGYTPLAMAAYHGNQSLCQLFIKHGALVDAQDNQSISALMDAALKGHHETCKILIQAGANIFCTAKFGNTALSFASKKKNNAPIVTMLLHLVTQLTEQEKKTLKYWLLVTKKIENEQRIYFPKDMRIYVAHMLYRSIAIDLQERVIRAGGLKALESAQAENQKNKDLSAITTIIADHLDLNFLVAIVRKQVLLKN